MGRPQWPTPRLNNRAPKLVFVGLTNAYVPKVGSTTHLYYRIRCALHTIHHTPDSVHYTLYTIQCKPLTLRYALYTKHYTPCSTHHTVLHHTLYPHAKSTLPRLALLYAEGAAQTWWSTSPNHPSSMKAGLETSNRRNTNKQILLHYH